MFKTKKTLFAALAAVSVSLAGAVGGHAQTPTPGKPCSVSLPGGVSLELVPISAGFFYMGSPSGEAERSDDEVRHPVRISKSFWLGKYEVTQGQWKALMGNNPSWFKKTGDNGPVEKVSWEDAMEFWQKLTQREKEAGRLPEGYEYRLPTEAEWEYACRAGTEGPFNTGSNLTTKQANYDGNYPYNGYRKGEDRERTVEVGSFAPNAWGLYDMHGNVWEWCLDVYNDYERRYEEDETGKTWQTLIDPISTLGRMNSDGERGSYRVLRGGSWCNSAQSCRCANRNDLDPALRGDFIGFRLALGSVR